MGKVCFGVVLRTVGLFLCLTGGYDTLVLLFQDPPPPVFPPCATPGSGLLVGILMISLGLYLIGGAATLLDFCYRWDPPSPTAVANEANAEQPAA